MKFINYLKSIDDVSIYPLLTLILFFTIFVLATILVFSKSKKTVDAISRIPLDD